MYILQRLVTGAWFVWIVAAVKALVWMGIYIEAHCGIVRLSVEQLSKMPETIYWEKTAKRWMIISLLIAASAIGYLVIVP